MINFNNKYGIIGTSLQHTLSPMIYGYLARRHNINGSYSVLEINENELGGIIGTIRENGFGGINVTFPFKLSIVEYLDELDRDAQTIETVNTVKILNDKLIGYNTDIFGISTTLANKLKFNPASKTVVILGAGGAARACLKYLLDSNIGRIYIVNRTISKANDISRYFKKIYPASIITCDNSDEFNLLREEHKIDLVINAMSADKSVTLDMIRTLARNNLLDDTAFFDLNYGERALNTGLPNGVSDRIDGLFMLAAQAVKNFEIWHGHKSNPDEVYEYLTHELKRYRYA